MGITSNESSQTPKEEKGRSLFGDLPRIIETCVRLFGKDDPVTLKYKQQLIDITLRRKQRGDDPNHYEEEEEEQWHAGMVPNLRPKSEKGLEEDEDWDDDWEEDPKDPKDSEDGPALNPEAPKAEPDLSPLSKAGGGGS